MLEFVPGLIATQHSSDGQGYSDLNFLMPELVQRIECRIGPYFVQSADFSGAGAADILYVKKLGALELMRNDGPWTLCEGLKRSNAVLGLSGGTAARD